MDKRGNILFILITFITNECEKVSNVKKWATEILDVVEGTYELIHDFPKLAKVLEKHDVTSINIWYNEV